jgi:ubiquinone/menaquinone biosynthesis C-methylase UbiE
MILTYRMPFQSSIKNNNLFISLEKNKQLYNQLLKIVGTANSIQGMKKDEDIYKKLHELYWSSNHKEPDKKKRAKNNAYTIYKISPKEISLFHRSKFVDIGCGDGSITKELAKLFKFGESICVDVENWFNTYKNKNKNIGLIITNGNRINIESNSVDVILCNHVLHHMMHLDDMLREVVRILKKDGVLIVKEHNCTTRDLSYLIDIYHALFELVYKKVQNPKFIPEYYAEYFSEREMTKKLEALGLRRIKFFYKKNAIGNYYSVFLKK